MRKRPEQELQKTIIQYLRVTCPKAIILHIPNGGYRTAREGAIFKGLGVLAGCPDLLLLWPTGRSGMVELKAPNNKGNLSEAQLNFKFRLDIIGVPHAIASSLNEIKDLVIKWGIPTRDSNLGW